MVLFSLVILASGTRQIDKTFIKGLLTTKDQELLKSHNKRKLCQQYRKSHFSGDKTAPSAVRFHCAWDCHIAWFWKFLKSAQIENSFLVLLGCPFERYRHNLRPASYPDISLAIKCVRKGWREGDNRLCLPSVPFPRSLAVYPQLLTSPLQKTKLLRRRLTQDTTLVEPWIVKTWGRGWVVLVVMQLSMLYPWGGGFSQDEVGNLIDDSDDWDNYIICKMTGMTRMTDHWDGWDD